MDIILRPWLRTDAAELAQRANSKEVAACVRDVFPNPYTLNDANDFIDYCLGGPKGAQLLAILVDGAVAGGISLTRGQDVNRRGAELGYWLGEEFWGRGIATEAVRQMITLGWRQKDLVRIWAVCFAANPASARVLEKNGFVLEGRLRRSVYKNGKIQDSLLYALVRED